MMTPAAFTEFTVSSLGHCFLCLNEISSPDNATHSIQYLARYLKMDMSKVYFSHQRGPFPLHLLGKLEKSRVGVELCGECSRLSERFAGLYRQLEKAEMEVTSCLGRIQGKILEANESGKTERFMRMGMEEDFQSGGRGGGGGGELELVRVLRGDTTQKCAKILCKAQPRVKIPKPKRRTPAASLPKPFDIEALLRSQKLGRRIGSSSTGRWSIDPATGRRRCNLCPYLFNTSAAFHNHFHKVHLKVRHACQLCGKTFPYKASLYLHHQSFHRGVRYSCDLCKKSFTTNAHKKNHQEQKMCDIKRRPRGGGVWASLGGPVLTSDLDPSPGMDDDDEDHDPQPVLHQGDHNNFINGDTDMTFDISRVKRERMHPPTLNMSEGETDEGEGEEEASSNSLSASEDSSQSHPSVFGF